MSATNPGTAAAPGRTGDAAEGGRGPREAVERDGGVAASLDSRQRRQLVWITAGALAIFAGLRLLPTGTSLSHMDFRVDPKAGSAIEFCDPLNPQFIPVVAVRSPVVMTLTPAQAAERGREVRAAVTLKTARGKLITPEDLLVTHTQRLHLLLVDATLEDYQHVHPTPATQGGAWEFVFTPQRSRTYRVFADFTPAATGRGLYASADLFVFAGDTSADLPVGQVSDLTKQTRSTSEGQVKDLTYGGASPVVERDGCRFTLATARSPVRAGQPVDLRFEVARTGGGSVMLEPVMGAFAHLVAFDEARSGFAHLHPVESDLLKPPDATRPTLNFKLTIPRAGRYVVWAQVKLAGRETFVPFGLEVRE